jgi:hypothetical protein
MRAVGEPPLFLIKPGLEAPAQKFLTDKHVLQNLKFLLLCRYNWHRSENRRETGMKKNPRWRFAIAISALSIIFVSAALAG